MRKFRKKLPERDTLLKLFTYRNGELIYNEIDYPPHKRLIGQRADFANAYGYKIVNVRTERRQYMAHRIIWKMFYDEEPDYIDHIDENPCNNRIENLQKCSNGFNMLKSAVNRGKGVSFMTSRGKWRARININKRQIHLGLFDTKEEAIERRKEAEREYFN